MCVLKLNWMYTNCSSCVLPDYGGRWGELAINSSLIYQDLPVVHLSNPLIFKDNPPCVALKAERIS